MTVKNETNNLDLRLSALEIRMASVEASLNNLVGVASTRKSKKMSEAQKDQMKKRLLRGLPYDKRRIEKLNLTELRILASAIKINSFGIKRDELIKIILSKQKK
jgi:hypothetical protein